jgi:hypothetical protein
MSEQRAWSRKVRFRQHDDSRGSDDGPPLRTGRRTPIAVLVLGASVTLGCTLITDVDRELIPEPVVPILSEVDAGDQGTTHPDAGDGTDAGDSPEPDAGDQGIGDAGDAG